jgi:oxaloacetate decarboxylase alpha subunit
MAEIKFVDQSIRDGQQSLWGLRMRMGHMLPVAPDMDRAGYDVIDITGSAMFEVMTRQFKENPWEMLDAMRAAVPNTELRAGTRPNASAGSGFTLAPAAVVDLFATTLVKHGIDSLWIYDCLYNVDQMERVARAISAAGAKAVPSLMYSLSEFHTDEFFADKVRQFAAWGCASSVYLEDASGVLTPDRAVTLIPAVVEAANGLPVELHCHNTTGLAPLNYLEGLKHGVVTIHTASRPLANGPSLPSVESMLENVRLLGHTAALNEDAVAAMAEYFESLAVAEGYELGAPAEYSVFPYEHQLPGGMLGTLKHQLATHGLGDRLQETLYEAATVRRELGSPVMATPISQLVGIQALLNVTTGERYGRVPDDVILYTLGRLGSPPGPMDPDVKDKILSSSRGKELAAISPAEPTVEELRRQHGRHLSDEELLLRTLLQQSEVDAMLGAGAAPRDLRPRSESPLVSLLRAMSATACSDAVHYQELGTAVTLQR